MLMCGGQNVLDPDRGHRHALWKIGKTSPKDAFQRLQDLPIIPRGFTRGALHHRQLLLEPLANQLHLWGTHEKHPDVISYRRPL